MLPKVSSLSTAFTRIVKASVRLDGCKNRLKDPDASSLKQDLLPVLAKCSQFGWLEATLKIKVYLE